MYIHRIIPCLLLQDQGLVKTIQFKNPKYVGDPINAVKIFNDKQADELIFLDITASKQRQGPNYALIQQIASECFMPLSYGGGITTAEQARKIIDLGVEKISLNTILLRQPELLTEIAACLGVQSVVAAMDVKKNWLGQYRVFNSATRQLTALDPVVYAQELEQRGAGELLLNSVDRDGMQQGYDATLLQRLARVLTIPLIACGGAGKLEDLKTAIDQGASAAAAGSLFVFHGKHRAVLITYPGYTKIKQLLGKT